MFLSLQLLHETKSIFCYQVQFFCFFYHLKSVITNLGWMGEINPQIILVAFPNYLEILLVNAFVPQLLHDTKSIFCHQVQFFYFPTT